MVNRTALCIVLAAVLAAPALAPAAEGWLTDYDQAVAEAKKTGKLILADFTGSDWCGWCIRLKKEVWDTEQFAAWAKENVVLLELDFPRKSEQPDALKKQNRALAEKYEIRGFPTILFLTPEGEVAGRSGYLRGGAKNWTDNADTLIEAHRKATTIDYADNLKAAKAAAAKDGKLLLVIAPADEAEGKTLDTGVLKDRNVLSVVNTHTVPVRVNDRSATGLKLEAVTLLDAKAEKVLTGAPADVKGDALVRGIYKAMPKAEYEPGAWIEDYPKAEVIAAQQDRAMLLDFTGSDWCGWCMKLHAEVFSKPAFEKYAKENLVLVKLDFPKKKEQPEQRKQQNRALAEKYGIRGFPTLIILSPAGEKLGQMGYMRGGPEPFLEKLSGLVKP